ncbi:RNA-directed DNA polymerase [Paenibacillus sp.]|uniref:RNA-directed DNA polymerase n=1 Tax=Paenibacillus sp. TaxID=58172 RepID=UPI002D5C9753|nr:RNA-directed DNA polymerase [Paenibacillus sp.]HZG87835.1 RNA-directed DNA polymerase [Paenibacillus sp.]
MELIEKIEISWRRVKADRRTDFIIGDFEYEVFDYYKNELLQGIVDNMLKQEEYKPKSLRTIRVPKTSYTTRPGSVPEIEDRIYYQYLVDEIADEIEEKLVPVEDRIVHSYRYNNNRTSSEMFLKGRASYTTFEGRTIEISNDFKYVIVTDVSSYFERIYHHELENTLRGLGATPTIVESLCELLRKWRKGNSYSIPQGIWPSDYLGNIYLDPVDKFMMRKGYVYCRFVDDIRIGVNSYLEAQSVLLLLEEKLASLGLTLNDAKTKIIPSEQIEEILFPHKQRIEEIKDEIRSASNFSFNPYVDFEEEDADDEDVDLTSARELFREQLSLEYPMPSITRFCLKHLNNFQDEEILEDVIKNLDRLVVVTPQVVGYLYSLYKIADEQGKYYISSSIASFIKDELTNYDWQIMWFLQLMSKFKSIGTDEVNSIREHIMNSNKEIHDAVLINALLLLGKHGDSADYEWILSLFDKNYSSWVRQGIIYSLRNMPKTKRNHFYGYCIGQDTRIDKVIDFIKKKY